LSQAAKTRMVSIRKNFFIIDSFYNAIVLHYGMFTKIWL
jgi:hypothetical protein